jgi:amidohydrolase
MAEYPGIFLSPVNKWIQLQYSTFVLFCLAAAADPVLKAGCRAPIMLGMDTQELNAVKSQVGDEINRHQADMRILSNRIHSHPEIAMNEHQAAAWLTQELETLGFRIERGTCGLPTAFRATYGTGKPTIAFIAEYDALPGLGHACGHNLIATAAVAAGIGTQKAVDKFGGTVQVIGTPAEEMTGGKIIMARQGAFTGIDAAMMMHPASLDSAMITALACVALDVEFFGKEAHAAAHPELGINALEAMILSFNAINSLRQHISTDSRVHGVITDGGKAANIVPAYSAGRFLVRAGDTRYLNSLKKRVLNCFEASAQATGARLEYRWDDQEYYAPMRNNVTLARLYVENMERTGHSVPLFNASQSFGSTDMGNVSQIVPSIHTSVSIAPPGEGEHTAEFARSAAQEHGLTQSLAAAAGLAMTAVDLLSSPDTLAAVRMEFDKT